VVDCLYLVLARREVASLLSADQRLLKLAARVCCHEQWHNIGLPPGQPSQPGDQQAHHELGWSPRWDFATALDRTLSWNSPLPPSQ
jgi:nucleoside-diphosphate-sugar epimerase